MRTNHVAATLFIPLSTSGFCLISLFSRDYASQARSTADIDTGSKCSEQTRFLVTDSYILGVRWAHHQTAETPTVRCLSNLLVCSGDAGEPWPTSTHGHNLQLIFWMYTRARHIIAQPYIPWGKITQQHTRTMYL